MCVVQPCCPWCGHDMKISKPRYSLRFGSAYEAWYECQACGARSPIGRVEDSEVRHNHVGGMLNINWKGIPMDVYRKAVSFTCRQQSF